MGQRGEEPAQRHSGLFDDELGPVEWYGRDQWEESRLVVDRAHAALRERRPHYSGVDIFIPTGLHFMLAYIEYKSGKISEQHWRNYVLAYPKGFKGIKAIRARVTSRLRRSVHNDLMNELHWLAVGEHSALIPLQPSVESASGKTPRVADDPQFQRTVELVRDVLKVLVTRSDLESIDDVISSLRGSIRYVNMRDSIIEVINLAYEASAEQAASDDCDDDVPF